MSRQLLIQRSAAAKMMTFSSLLLSLLLLSFDSGCMLVAGQTLIVGNTRGTTTNAVSIDADGVVTPFLDADSKTPSPDFMKIYNGFLYVANGDTESTSSINKLTLDGEFVEVFATGNGMVRPYGFDFYDGVLYVSSFKSDQILSFSAETGDFIEVFAAGDGTREGLCNGPNHMAIVDGTMYVTTQGSVTILGEVTYPGYPSEVLKYDIATKKGEVFIEQPEVLDGSLGFVSMLGLIVECARDGTCTFYTTDFGGGLRVYSLPAGRSAAPSLVYAVGTTYADGASTGALAIDDDEGVIYIPAFTSEDTPGVVLKFNKDDGASLNGDSGFFLESTSLVRPIGALFIPRCGIVCRILAFFRRLFGRG